MSPHLEEMHAHYLQGGEVDRLGSGVGSIEFMRTLEVLERALPSAPALIADIGGGPGRYALHFASRHYRVIHRDVVPLHVHQLRAAAKREHLKIDTELGDARSLDLPRASVDAVLLLGPLYHLGTKADRLKALREARRIAKPGAPIFIAAISRWAPRLAGEIVGRLAETIADLHPVTLEVERTGALPAVLPDGFTGYCHRPQQLRSEIRAAGLEFEDLVGLEGIAFALNDVDERLENERARAALLACARELERVPELLGLSPHLLATARAPGRAKAKRRRGVPER